MYASAPYFFATVDIRIHWVLHLKKNVRIRFFCEKKLYLGSIINMKDRYQSDLELLTAIHEGNEKAFEHLYRRYHNRLHKFLTRFAADDSTKADDILQEAFLRVWLNRDRLPEIEHFENWIFTLVGNESRTFLRKELHIRDKTQRLKESYEQKQIEHAVLPRLIEFDELQQIIKDAVEGMPVQRKKIYQLSREEGMSSLEIATALQISQNTVYNTLTSALKQIRKTLADRGYTVSLTILILLKII